MFSALIEKYFFINYIPGTRLFSLPYNVYIYIFLIIGFFTILFLKYNNFFEKKDLQKTIFIFLITIWFLSGITWLITEINWLRLDINNFFNKTLDQKRNNIINKVIKGYNMPENWHDFYLFLQKAKLSLANE